MNKPLSSFLMFLCVALSDLPTAARAGGGYLSLTVPDLPQAVGFFHEVLNCEPLSEGVSPGVTAVALLDCGDGSIVELSAGTSRTNPPRRHAAAEPALATRDAVAAAAWLRASHVRVIGQPRRVAEGHGASRTVVRFVTPWGQPLQLVSDAAASEIPAHATAGAGLAAQ